MFNNYTDGTLDVKDIYSAKAQLKQLELCTVGTELFKDTCR